jgi:hypothetical protein
MRDSADVFYLYETVAVVPGCYQMWALTARAYIAIAQDQPEQAERDAHEALAIAARPPKALTPKASPSVAASAPSLAAAYWSDWAR